MLRMELAEGVILDGHYRLRQLLGRGGMGEVWEATHTRLPKLFAIKFLSAFSKAEPELLMRFRREAEIASRLAHPSIVQVTDFNILPDGTAYIAMERLHGEDLRARLGRGPVSLEEAREITRQVASALSLSHREGVVHRDLKPENIFLCREPDGSLRAKVLDFGISKLQGNLGVGVVGTRDDRVLGTPGYMAPEQAMGKNSEIDGRTDLFSLASIVYEMLTGKGVFMGDTLAELCTKVLYHTPPPLDEVLPAVPRALAMAVSMALSKDPAARQSEIRLFAEAVAGAAPAMPSSPPVPGTSGFSATVASDVRPLHAPTQVPSRPPAVATREVVPIDASDVVTRSRRPAGVASSQPARPGKKRTILASASLVVLLLGAAVWLELRRERSPHVEPLALPAGAPSPALPAMPRASDPPAVPRAGDPLEAPDAAVALEQSSTTPVATSEPAARATHAGKHAELPEKQKATLLDAERALSRADFAEALRLARGSLRDGSSERAYLVMARAYCGQRDVGMVQAMLRNVSAGARKQVRKECLGLGLTVP
jgi:serine/threonine protein kinase